MIAAVFRPLRLAVALALSCLLLLTGCHPTQFKTKAAQVSQLVLVTPNNPATFNYPLSQSPYSVFPFIYEELVRENGITAEIDLGNRYRSPKNHRQWSLANGKLHSFSAPGLTAQSLLLAL